MSMRGQLARGFMRLPPATRRRILHRIGRYAPWEPEFDFTPPALAPGQHRGPPDFVGIGVQKAGTTWWYERIVAHPGVFAPAGVHKERHYFDRFGARPMSEADAAGYHGWFPRPAGMLTGEWTPDYFTFPWVPPLLARAAPDARLLLLLRDPVERFRSGLAHHARMGQPVDGPAVADAVQRGHYHAALETWLEHVDADRLLVVQLERCVLEPDVEMARTLAHLGLVPTDATRSTAAFPQSLDRVPPTGRARPELGDQVVDALVQLYEPDVVALTRTVGHLDVALWPNFAYLADPDRASGSSSPTSRR
jgi:Sulfotransferase family